MHMDDPYAALAIRAGSRLRTGARRQTSAPSAPTTPKASTPSAAKAAPASRFAQADIDRAVAVARAEERARVAAVFASDASQGRERACVKLLAHKSGFAASAIIAEIASQPSDADRAKAALTVKVEKASATWDRAYGSIGNVPGKVTAKAGAKSADEPLDVWERAYAKVSSV